MPVRRNTTSGFLQWVEFGIGHITVFNESFVYEATIEDKDCLLYFNSSYIVGVSCQEEHPSVCAYGYTHQLKKMCDDLDSCQSGLTAESDCVTIDEHGLTWPETKAGLEAYPAEYCFSSCSKLCGAEGILASVYYSCQTASESPITPSLRTLITSRLSYDAVEQLYEISTNYRLFADFDVYLSASLLSFLSQFLSDKFYDIIDNILKIEKDVLSKSQLNTCATDTWLDNAKMAFGALYFGELKVKTNFAFGEFFFSASGILNEKSSDGSIKVSATALEDTLDSIVTSENFESAFWINAKVYGDFMIVYYIYFNKGFFPDEKLPEKSSYVFGIDASSVGIEEPRYLVYRFDATTFTKNVTCFYWSRQKGVRSSWKEDGEFQIYKSSFVCKFWRNAEFTLALRDPKDITATLEEILASSANSSEILARLLQASSRYDEFASLDVYLVGQILKKITSCNDNDLELLSKIISFLQKIDKEVLRESQMKYNATDTILYHTDTIIKNQETSSDLQFITDNFVIFSFHLNSTHFGGLLLFQDGRIEISTTIDVTELLQFENLDSALILSSELKDQMDLDDKIIVNVFFKDVLFNEKKQYVQHQGVTKIYDIILPDNLTYSTPVTLFYNISNYQDLCSYWSYNVPENIPGFWQNDSKGENFSSLIQCDFWHTTHFALLILDEDKYKEDEILDVLTYVTLSFSLFGFLWIILTAFLFKNWRSKAGNKILLNFVFSGVLQIVVFYISGSFKKSSQSFCIFTGMLLHYSVLAQFCWMLNIAVLQFKRFVIVLGIYSSHILLKTCLFAWGLPLLPVICVVVVDPDSYISGSVGLCYPSGYGLYLGIWLPICAIIVANLIIYIYVIRAVLLPKSDRHTVGGEEAIYQWRLIIFLFFMLGLTWIFGFLAEFDNGRGFVYLFCILASLQGFVMFLFFIVFNENVRDLYAQKI